MTTAFDFDNLIKQSLYTAKISSMLAQENISVAFDSQAETASFNDLNRTIRFPYSTAFMDPDIHELFIFHEVSHALHLPVNYRQLVDKSGVGFDYFNIVVDIRDERLIKKKYPGAVPMFVRAYEKMVELGFFGPKADIKFKSFPDRLNAYAKLGIKTGAFIPLDADEMDFYNRCMAAETLEEVLTLSAELAGLHNKFVVDFSDLMRQAMENLGDKIEDDELTEEQRQLLIEAEMQKMRENRVQQMFDDAFKGSIVNNAHVVGFEPLSEGYCQMLTAQQYSSWVKKSREENRIDLPSYTLQVREMRKDIRMSVDSMVRVFESKKAAERAKMAKVSDTGLIDINKVHRYKFDENIFRRATRLPNSKNHAYFILVDLSGSMMNTMSSVIEQIMVMTEFFRRIQVPYKVVGFGASIYIDGLFTPKRVVSQPNPAIVGHYYNGETIEPRFLFEMLNSEQTTFEHNIGLSGLMHYTGFGLGDTPTTHAVFASERIANDFFRKVGADKKHIVVITDGEPTDSSNTRSYGNYGRTTIVTDAMTKTAVICKGNANYSFINAFGKIIENRIGAKFTTLSLVNNFNETRTSAFVSAGIDEKDASSFRKKGFARILDPFTQNPIFFAKPFHVDTGVDEFDIADKKTSTQIARAMIGNMKKVNKSRNFLNALAESLS